MSKSLAIVEDTIDNIEVIRYFLNKHYPTLKIVGEARSVDDAQDLLAHHQPDIALLDIQIVGGTSFDVLARLDAAGIVFPQLIFITAHGVVENATKALRYTALDFIVKPVDENLLREALDRAIDRIDSHEDLLGDIRSMLEQQHRGDRFERVVIRLIGGIRRLVSVQDLVYFQAGREVTKVFLVSGEVLVAAVNIGHFKRTLQEDHDFLLVHQSYLVNAGHIQQFDPRAGEVKLITGQRLATSQTGTTVLRAWVSKQEEGEIRPGLGILERLRGLVGRR